jgi:transcriptional regulator with XRE-family HTH domain
MSVASDGMALAVARAIRAERARADLTQEELGARAGLHRNTVGAIETLTRKVTVDELPDICDALGITLADLFAKIPPEDRRKLGLQS